MSGTFIIRCWVISFMLQRLNNDRGELLFLAGVTLITGYLMYATASLERPDSASVPWVILVIMLSSLVSIYVMKLFGDRIEGILGLGSDEDWMDVDDESDDAGMFEIDLWGVSKELGWITAYIVSLLYIGFFTATIVFINAYIFVNEQSPLKYRLAYMAIWTAGLMTVIWVLFIELLRVSALFRLGFLP